MLNSGRFFYVLMNKEEILHRLKTSGQLHTMDDTPEWKAAFKLHRETTGVKFDIKHMCQKCFQKVSDWLKDIKE